MRRKKSSLQHLTRSDQGSSGPVGVGRGAGCFSSLGVRGPNFGGAVKNNACEESQVKYGRACA